jgi:hypothetical protein
MKDNRQLWRQVALDFFRDEGGISANMGVELVK